MATASPEISDCRPCSASEAASPLAATVRDGLAASPKSLPPWLFYDEAGSLLFEQITCLPEYYLTRIERGIFEARAGEMIAAAASEKRLRIVELGAGSADKTRLLLAAASRRQGSVRYQPVDVSETALEGARERLEAELAEVLVEPLVADYTHGLLLDPCGSGERRLVLFIGSSIGNFDPAQAAALLQGLAEALDPGDALLLGVDLAPSLDPAANGEEGKKSLGALLAAYDDAQGVTASFNKNLLVRLNRKLGAEFDLEAFRHRVRWNSGESRIEMHLESDRAQTVRIPALDLVVDFTRGETIHTENSYKYRPGQAESLLSTAGFEIARRWGDAAGWFAVFLAVRGRG